MAKVSVIVPIYDVERYIERCVRSLMEQTLDDIEYIFVNDCTPDHSMDVLEKVLKEYPQRRMCIKIFHHKKNAGLATVRNTGLENATGEYIIHCDSDDWVEKNMYEAMFLKAQESGADIVATDYYEEHLKKTIIRKQNYPDNPIDCIRKMLSGDLHCGTWNKLVKREIYQTNNIHFPDGINMWEDVLTTIPIFYHASKIVYLPRPYYHYVQYNADSYTKRMKESSLQNLIVAVKLLDTFLEVNNLQALHRELCNTKLTVKLNLLLNSSGEQQKRWNLLYPEANPYIFAQHHIAMAWRLALKLASCNLLIIFNILAGISIYAKRFVRGKIS